MVFGNPETTKGGSMPAREGFSFKNHPNEI